MKIKNLLIGLLIPLVILMSSWGFFGHQRINRYAVFTLPRDLIGFYKNNINYITAHAVDPDKRRYADSLEARRHYLDADHYGKDPFKLIPRKWDEAVKKLSEDTLNAYGIVPWQIQRSYYKLVNAFKNRDSILIIKYSEDLSHYIADAHVPLHTSENYNGQMTNQVGIHGFWESRLPELFAHDYDYFVGKAQYIENPLNKAWDIVEHTFSMLDSTLTIEKKLSQTFPEDRKYTFNERNGKVIREYSIEYSKAYHVALNGMVERQMRSSIIDVGSFWYSAWVDAGQPDMHHLIKKDLTEQEKKELAKEDQLFKNGKPLGRPETQ
ncbi:MAG: zinc dependent phospholipase C family protein [Sphingobacteriales bacterium]|nr:zinc dependent phospholipase C family protein [Sphingobacteriales bacterium]